MPEGTVGQLWRYPVKSMAGERLASTRVDGHGVGGDRTHAVWWERDGRPKMLDATQAPRLLKWRAEYPFAPDDAVDPADPPEAQVIAPDGHRFSFADARLRELLAADIGRPLELRRDVAGHQDVRASLLVTVAASLRALGNELRRDVDVRRFRPNLHLELDSQPFAEAGWEGARLEFEGGVVLRLIGPCDRCSIPTRDPDTLEGWGELLRRINESHDTFFGIRARVEKAGRIALGEHVAVQPPG